MHLQCDCCHPEAFLKAPITDSLNIRRNSECLDLVGTRELEKKLGHPLIYCENAWLKITSTTAGIPTVVARDRFPNRMRESVKEDLISVAVAVRIDRNRDRSANVIKTLSSMTSNDAGFPYQNSNPRGNRHLQIDAIQSPKHWT
jgi:hypothetical protein